ncbi:hypothetical protein FA95DRAFT_559895 [Auriscalpium vulgare]|uniref:Uncharacterized protein n=1 Tax=Auriscalpium vulgare TaxID=40419 RepID=A0ACB8RG06_9AGAM|nr:hypothetical protein FA95DRAFT_559895 [Auriscalpium vulgare]
MPDVPHSLSSRNRKFRTVLGLSNILQDGDDPHPHPSTKPYASLIRRSVDLVASTKSKPRANIADASFFEPSTTVFVDPSPPSPIMKAQQEPHSRPVRRQVLRMDAQDGPWTVSVAENPHHPASFSLYVKTPTHNLTLSRTAREIVELDQKLHDSYPHIPRPQLPPEVSAVPLPPKRKSAFLNTLSRLASPSSKANGVRHATRPTAPSSPLPSTLPTPLSSPNAEINDPFLADPAAGGFAALGPPTSASPVLTALSAYLTTLSNDQVFRQARTWKRFVRVRTDDLESVRVERAIKRVRSDIAAHMTSPSTVDVHVLDSSDVPDEATTDAQNGDVLVARPPALERRESRFREDIPDDDAPDAASMATTTDDNATADQHTEPRSAHPSIAASSLASTAPIEIEASDAGSVAEPAAQGEQDAAAAPPTPVTPAARIPRSQSADPDKAARLSRVFTPSTVSQPDGTDTPSQTEDDSSVSTSHERRKRKKRSKSEDPNRELKKRAQRKVQVSDFEMMRVLGKGCAGKVLLVRHKSSADLYALKAITKRHVLAHQELQHTLTEQAVLKRMAAEGSDPFVVKLWWSFHDKENLFLVMDFHPGGDLATQLARWGRLGRDRARFYAAEIVEGVEGLHHVGVIYRDLKPENILIAADGHIVLTDFGLSKEFPRRATALTTPSTPNGQQSGFSTPPTPYWMKDGQPPANGWPPRLNDTTTTFCGTAEYLAPEVIQGLPYSYEVDWWSFGTMLYEMLTGITPFWADNHSDMYVRVLQDELQFPDERAMDHDTRSLIRGLLQRNPTLRIGEPRIKAHPYFSMIDWLHVYHKRYIPPYIPPIDPLNASDTQNFDETFLDMEPVINDENEDMETDPDPEREQTDVERTDGEDSSTTPSQSRSSSVHPPIEDSVDVFDGYSFKGRHSVILDDEDGVPEGSSEEDEGTDEEAATRSILAELNEAVAPVEKPVEDESLPADDEQTPEPKTPEARVAVLPATPKESPAHVEVNLPETVPKPPSVVTDVVPPVPAKDDLPSPITPKSPSKGAALTAIASAAAAATASAPADVRVKEPKKAAKPSRPPRVRNRREKSGVPALDRDLSDVNDEDVATERDEEDDEWDFIEADGEDRNGAKGTSLFARGVVDRYKLSVFRKGSTPNRSVSAMSQLSEVAASVGSASPSPAGKDKERRGRSTGLPFRKTPFLRPKSPPSSRSSKSNTTVKTLTHSTSATLTASTTSSLLPSPQSGRNALAMSPSLKSKESAISMGSPNSSSDTSVNEEARGQNGDVTDSGKANPPQAGDEQEKQKNKKLKKYKEGAEKVMLSLFTSPR